jgi:hypothetical protein
MNQITMNKSILISFILLFNIKLNYAQIGIGTDTPNSSAKLEISASDKGFLAPRVALTATNSGSPITSPATGLIVYNTATAGASPYNVSPGYYYYDGTIWVSMSASTIIPAGSVQTFAGSSAPVGYLICDGAAISRTIYANLFAAIGTLYGVGNGSTTFNLPDLRGRTIIGAGQGAGLTNRTIASKGGEETHTLTVNEMPSHAHGVNDPGHNHGTYNGRDDGNISNQSGQASPGDASANTNGWPTAAATTGISIQNNGGGAAHNVMQPCLTLNYIIKF